MKPIHLFLPIIITGLISCQPSPQAEAVHPPLPEVDIYADYPQKQMDISSLAEVVYIPMPKKPRSESLSSFHSTFDGCVSEDLIVSYTQEGDVEVFNHDGKKVNGFNRLGEGEEEYPYIFDLFLDKDRQEIWILKYGIKFNIYALNGTFKRSIKLPDNQNVKILADYSCDSLLCYDDYLVADGLNKTPYPFYLLSKEDGGMQKLTSIRVFQRLNNQERFILNLNHIKKMQILNYEISTCPMVVCNGKAVLADYAKDTVFTYQDGKTTPLFVRKPSVFASLPFILSSMDFVTERFLFLSFTEKANAKDTFYRDLLYDFTDGGIYEYQLQNLDFEPAFNVRISMYNGHYPSNWLVNEITVDRFLKYHREGKLKGKAAEAATKLKSTDTSVLILYKFHNKQ